MFPLFTLASFVLGFFDKVTQVVAVHTHDPLVNLGMMACIALGSLCAVAITTVIVFDAEPDMVL